MKLPSPIFFVALIPLALTTALASMPSTYAPVKVEKASTKPKQANVKPINSATTFTGQFKGDAEEGWVTQEEDYVYFSNCNTEEATCMYPLAPKKVITFQTVTGKLYTLEYIASDVLDVSAAAGTQYITVSNLKNVTN